MESIRFHEVAVKVLESYDAAQQHLLFLKELEENTPGWMKWLMAKRGLQC